MTLKPQIGSEWDVGRDMFIARSRSGDVESILLTAIKQDPSNPTTVEYVRRELTRRLRTKRQSLSSGALRSSPALAGRLAESELERLKAASPDMAPIARLLP